jgi:hypothetical protein
MFPFCCGFVSSTKSAWKLFNCSAGPLVKAAQLSVQLVGINKIVSASAEQFRESLGE